MALTCGMPLVVLTSYAGDRDGSEESRRLASMLAHPSMEGRMPCFC